MGSEGGPLPAAASAAPPAPESAPAPAPAPALNASAGDGSSASGGGSPPGAGPAAPGLDAPSAGVPAMDGAAAAAGSASVRSASAGGGTKRMKTDGSKEEKPAQKLPPFVVTLPIGFPAADPAMTLNYSGMTQFTEHLSGLLDARFTAIQDNLDLLGQRIQEDSNWNVQRFATVETDLDKLKTDVGLYSTQLMSKQQEWSQKVEAVLVDHNAKFEKLRDAMATAEAHVTKSYDVAEQLIAQVTTSKTTVEHVVAEVQRQQQQLVGLIAFAQNAQAPPAAAATAQDAAVRGGVSPYRSTGPGSTAVGAGPGSCAVGCSGDRLSGCRGIGSAPWR